MRQNYLLQSAVCSPFCCARGKELESPVFILITSFDAKQIEFKQALSLRVYNFGAVTVFY